MTAFLTLREVSLQSVGGFRRSQLDVDGDRLLVGQNNAGKTTLLRILRWLLIDADEQLFTAQRSLTRDEAALLVPSQRLGGKARELVARIVIHDGRVARKFGVGKGEEIDLLVLFRSGGPIARLRRLKRGEAAQTDVLALELLRRLQSEYHVTYVPPTRGSSIGDQLASLIATRLADRYEVAAMGRPQAEVRQFRAARDLIEKMTATAASELVEQLVGLAPVNLPLTAHVQDEAGGLVRRSAEAIPKRISFGEPGQQQVPLESVGSGSLSLLELAAHQMLAQSEGKRHLMLIEEPEAFLHPTAQELVGQWLYNGVDRLVIATSHSPTVAYQAKPSAIRVVHDHVVYRPQLVDALQDDKDAWLHGTVAAAALFLPSLLLVEGPGEVAFFSAMKARLRSILGDHVVSAMGVEAVGSNTQFAPWVRYLTRFQSHISGQSPVRFLVLADSRDSGAEIARVAEECPWALKTSPQAFRDVAHGFPKSDYTCASRDVIAARTRQLNQELMRSGDAVLLSTIDLEFAILSDVSESRASSIGTALGFEVTSRDELLRKLGSKGGGSKPSDSATKAPYIRRLLAESLDWTEVSPVFKDVLWAWASNTRRAKTRPRELEVA